MTKPRLLVVDDETDICELIADVAETRDFEVRTLSDPEQVESALRDFRPDALMLDLMMPGTDGVELLRHLGGAIKGIAVVLMSGHDSRVLNSARRLGAAHGIDVVATQEKPLTVEGLRATLERLAQTRVRAEAQKPDLAAESAENAEGLTVFYQPIADMETGRVRGGEALARWNHPTAGLLSPEQFLPSLDEAAMKDLTMRMAASVLRDAAVLQSKGFPLALSVNMPLSTLTDLAVPDRLDELCHTHGVPPERINIEVTEGEAMREVNRVMDVLTRLRLRGFGLAIDDFGTGYSSLRELQRLPFSVMKMDKSFVLDMAENRDNQVIGHAIIELGHNLSLKVVAEGIESARVWNLLKERGCDMAQGYFISRPLPLGDLGLWLYTNSGLFAP